MFRAGLHPCGLVMFLALKDIVCDDQIVFWGKTQKKFTVWVALANSTRANHTWPFVHLSSPGIEVSGYYQLISTRNSPQNVFQIVVEFLLKLFGVGHFWSLDTQLWRRTHFTAAEVSWWLSCHWQVSVLVLAAEQWSSLLQNHL